MNQIKPSSQTASSEFGADQMSAIIRGLYLGVLGREADPPGLAHWMSLWRAGADVQTLAAGMVNSEEYRQRIGAPCFSELNAVRLTECAVAQARTKLLEASLTIVDVGAQNLANEDHVYAAVTRHELPHRIVGFEPLEHRRNERLAKTEDASLTLLPAFIGDGAEHIFHVNEPDATSSLLPFNREIIDRLVGLNGLQTVHTEPAHTTTLDIALRDEPNIDLLKLDIQGFELSALRHANRTLNRTLVVQCEVSFVEIYQGQPLFSEVERHMRGAGFELVDLRSLCRYPLTHTPFDQSRDWLGWADAVFFRRLGDTSSWRDRMVQSLIALVVYNKPSLAAWLARELTDTPAETYRRTLYTAMG